MRNATVEPFGEWGHILVKHVGLSKADSWLVRPNTAATLLVSLVDLCACAAQGGSTAALSSNHAALPANLPTFSCFGRIVEQQLSLLSGCS